MFENLSSRLATNVPIAAALSAIAIAAPVSTAAAATTARAAGPGDGPAVTGATYITTAPSTFINNNNQSSSADNSLGDQTA